MGIHLRSIGKSFGSPPTSVLKGVTLEIEDGDLVAVTGRSGSGKSTLLYIMSSLDHPTEGSLEISGKRVDTLSSKEVHAFRNQEMGFVFQFHYLLPEITVLENVLMPARKTRTEKKREPHALELLKKFELSDKRDRYPRQLSGGERQRVAIARALVMEPKFVFADEPTGNLDSVNGEIVMNILFSINREKKTTVVYVTHDQDYAERAPRKIRLVDGEMQ